MGNTIQTIHKSWSDKMYGEDVVVRLEFTVRYVKDHLQDFGDQTKFYLHWNDETKYATKSQIDQLTYLDNLLYVDIVPTSYHKLIRSGSNNRFIIYRQLSCTKKDDGREFITWSVIRH
ncbi:MAG: hypothetical protein Dasosvirus4_23 [Dasosvirus sp.]|uniref:Uncharacterized protein n=1 Tax=Dasosvirus sp. TaxID=2487764 RepID=A0A3G4ZRG3_9VIRU|nr:MAG: hypothetical protein Dasosvirus4_23 [Dasosvirus sp.]